MNFMLAADVASDVGCLQRVDEFASRDQGQRTVGFLEVPSFNFRMALLSGGVFGVRLFTEQKKANLLRRTLQAHQASAL